MRWDAKKGPMSEPINLKSLAIVAERLREQEAPLKAAGDPAGLGVGAAALLVERAGEEIARLRLVEEDHKNVLKAALYIEPQGIDLVNRLTTYALSQRKM